MVDWVDTYGDGRHWEADMGVYTGKWAPIVGPREGVVPIRWEVDFHVGPGTSFTEMRSGPYVYAYRYAYLGDDAIRLEACGYGWYRFTPLSFLDDPTHHLLVGVWPPYPDRTPPPEPPEFYVPAAYSALGTAPNPVTPKGNTYRDRIKLCHDTGQRRFTTVGAHRIAEDGANGIEFTGEGNDIFFSWVAPKDKAEGEVAYFNLAFNEGASIDNIGEVNWSILDGKTYATLDWTSDPTDYLPSPYAGFTIDYTPNKTYTFKISGYNLAGIAWGRALLQATSDWVDDLATFDWDVSSVDYGGNAIWSEYDFAQDFPDHATGHHPWLDSAIIACCWAHAVVGNSGGYSGSAYTCPGIGGVSLSNTLGTYGGFAIGKNLYWAEDDFFGDDLTARMWMGSTYYTPDDQFQYSTPARNFRNSQGALHYGADPVTGSTDIAFRDPPKFAGMTLKPQTQDAAAGNRIDLGAMDAVVHVVSDIVSNRDEALRWTPDDGTEIARLSFGNGSETATTHAITRADLTNIDGAMTLSLLVSPSDRSTPVPAVLDSNEYEYSGGNVWLGHMWDGPWQVYYGPHRYYTTIDRRPRAFDPHLSDTICGHVVGSHADNGQRWYDQLLQ